MNLNVVYAQIRERQKKALNLRRQAIFAQVPELAHMVQQQYALQQKRLDISIHRTRLENPMGELQDLEEQVTDLKTQIAQRLALAGLSAADLQLAYDCAICKDYGTVRGKPCACSVPLSAKQQARTSGVLSNKRFDAISYTHLSPEAQASFEKIVRYCADFALSTPDCKTGVFLFGGTGVGKSMLLHCIGNVAIAQGRSVKLLNTSAYNRFILETVVNQKQYQALDHLFNVDLLILDDLGSESKVTNITEQYVLMLVDYRLSKGLRCAFATNETPTQLQACYGERIASRLLDKTCMELFKINCADYRVSG